MPFVIAADGFFIGFKNEAMIGRSGSGRLWFFGRYFFCFWDFFLG
jgi:hypothetical protein